MEEIVALLRERGPLKTSEIAELLGISPQAAYYHLKRLERKGIVIRIGGERGRGRSAVWRIGKSGDRTAANEIAFLVGKSLAWVNAQKKGNAWDFLGVRREATTTVFALLLNAEIEGRMLPLPKELSLETSKRLLAKEVEAEYYLFLSRYYYLASEKRNLSKTIRKLQRILAEIRQSPNVSFESVAALTILISKPYLHLFDKDVVDLVVETIRKDTKYLSGTSHWETALGWMALARLELGMRKEAYKLYRELLPRMIVKGDEAYLEDKPPLYLIRLYGLEKATLDPTTLMFVLSRRFGNENLSKKLLNHIKRHQTPEGAFVVSQELGPDLARTEIVAYLLWYSISSLLSAL